MWRRRTTQAGDAGDVGAPLGEGESLCEKRRRPLLGGEEVRVTSGAAGIISGSLGPGALVNLYGLGGVGGSMVLVGLVVLVEL